MNFLKIFKNEDTHSTFETPSTNKFFAFIKKVFLHTLVEINF